MTNNEQDTSEEFIKDDSEETAVQRYFVLPRNIRTTKAIIAIVINFIIGGVSFGLAIYFFIKPWEDSLYSKILASLLLIFGSATLLQFPFAIARTFLSYLNLGEKTITLRNSFRIKEMKWDEIQDILIRTKLSRDMASNELIGLDLIRFRSVTDAIFFLGDNYPKEDAFEIISSVIDTFKFSVEGTEYKIIEQTERPSIQIRMIYLIKETKDKIN